MLLQPGARPVPNSPDYQLIRKLGAGAFGDVWHAHGPGGVDVALKFIRLDSAARYLELRSLEVMKSKRHPNLVSLFGAWRTDNWLILAMELCDRTLQERLAEALNRKLPGIPPDELLGYMRDAASGLDYLNDMQVQHRDVKPANLLMLGSGVKVADFGLAKVLEQTVGSNTGAGTLAYTAPECFKGQLTQHSDQYSLAVTFYHLRTGQPLFRGNQAEVTYAHLMSEPDLLCLPRAERAVLARALAKEPAERWPSCKALVSELGRAQHAVSQKDVRQNQPLDEPSDTSSETERARSITAERCPNCGRPLEKRHNAKTGGCFLVCMGWNDNEAPCTYSKPDSDRQANVRPPTEAPQTRKPAGVEVPDPSPPATRSTDGGKHAQSRSHPLPKPDGWSQVGGCSLAVLLFACIAYTTTNNVIRIEILLPAYALCLISAGFFARAIGWIRKSLRENQQNPPRS